MDLDTDNKKSRSFFLRKNLRDNFPFMLQWALPTAISVSLLPELTADS